MVHFIPGRASYLLNFLSARLREVVRASLNASREATLVNGKAARKCKVAAWGPVFSLPIYLIIVHRLERPT